MKFSVLTIFPDLLESPLREGIIRKALQAGQISIEITDIRKFATDKHATTDGRPFGGGEGMVMKPEPLTLALDSVKKTNPKGRTILLSPQGRKLDQQLVMELRNESQLILVCGRYEAVDERFTERSVDEEISVGDYILSGGELGAMIIIDAVTRVCPEVLGCAASYRNETFSNGLLKHPQYTRPRTFKGREVPAVLCGGDHQKIREYRFISAVAQTLSKRSELIQARDFSKKERMLLKDAGLIDQVDQVKKNSYG